jgi:hypothetical protein
MTTSKPTGHPVEMNRRVNLLVVVRALPEKTADDKFD